MADIGSGFNSNVKKTRKVQAEIVKATDDFWKNDVDKDNGDCKQKPKTTRQTWVSRSSSRLQRKIDDKNDELYVDSISSNSSDDDVEADTSDSDFEAVLYKNSPKKRAATNKKNKSKATKKSKKTNMKDEKMAKKTNKKYERDSIEVLSLLRNIP